MDLEIKRKTAQPVYLVIVNHIKNLIKQGDLLPGDQLLSERELCNQFKVSRTSVRKALAILSGMGLVDVTPRDGAYVVEAGSSQAIASLGQMVSRNRHQAANIYEVRRLIEVQAARLAAMRRDDADIVKLWEAYNRTVDHVRNGKRVHEADMDLHASIAQSTKNPFFSELMMVLISAYMEIFDLVWEKRGTDQEENNLFEYFLNQHRLIVQAIADQDQESAAFYMAQHVDDSRKRYESALIANATSNKT